MAKTIALIASLDTKKKETLYAASVIQKSGRRGRYHTGGNIKTLRDRVGRF